MTRTRSHLKRHYLFRPSSPHRPDYTLLGAIIFLLILGVLFVYEASVIEAYHQFNDQLHFAKLQFKWTLFGLGILTATSLVKPTFLKKIAFPLFVSSVLLLILVLLPGVGSNIKGATRWLKLGNLTLQPTELVKFSLILYLASLYQHKPKPQIFIIITTAISFLIMLQPDLGTTIIIATLSFVMFFTAGGSLTALLLTGLSASLLGLLLIFSSPYRRDRLFTFLQPNHDPLGASYHIRQIIIALGSGGLLGTGFGRSLQKYRFLPEATTDSIFAVIAEETGFFGSLVIISLFLFLAFKGLYIARHLPDRFMSLTALGATCLITLQAFLNLSAMAALVPLTGITLPFISYGGSSLLISLASAGLLINLSRFTIEVPRS